MPSGPPVTPPPGDNDPDDSSSEAVTDEAVAEEVSAYMRFSHDELKNLCRNSKLKVTGNKTVLATRLARRTIIEPPTELQIKFIHDLEKQLGYKANVEAFRSKKLARAWIDQALEERKRRQADKKK